MIQQIQIAMLRLQNFALLLADDPDPFADVSKPIINLINSALSPALGIVGALGAVYCVILGAKLAKAEEPQEREKAKSALKNAILGFVLIFVLLVAFKIGMGSMQKWYENSIK